MSKALLGDPMGSCRDHKGSTRGRGGAFKALGGGATNGGLSQWHSLDRGKTLGEGAWGGASTGTFFGYMDVRGWSESST